MANTNTVIGNVASVNNGEIASLFSQVKKWSLIACGTLCVGLGLAGIFLPLLPTTPFLLLAAICYAGSSPRFYDWLMNNRWFGRYIKNYREGKGLTLMTKIVSLASLWITIGYSAAFVMPWLSGKLALIVIALGVTAHILRRPTCRL
jgi:uncharacterized membrane protein YbaN (DUF454 family)